MGEDVSAGAGAELARRGPVALVVSPHAGHAGGGAPLEALEAAGVRVGEQFVVSDLDHRLPQGAAWRARGIVAAVAAGGDGTIGAVATQVAEAGLPLGILPLGTSNDVARALGVPLDLAGACAALARGAPVEVDAGQVLPAATEPGALAVEPRPRARADTDTDADTELHTALAASGAYFVHALTLGLNVSFARLATDVARRQRWGSLTYATSALEAVTRFEPVPVSLRLSEGRALGLDGIWRAARGEMEVVCRAVQVAVVNTPVFGGAMNLRVPRVDFHDRLLDFLVIEALEPATLRETIEGLLRALEKLSESFASRVAALEPGDGTEKPASWQGTTHAVSADEPAVHALPGVRRYQARAAIIQTPRHVDVTLDGEIRAHTPAWVRIAPEPLRVLLPGRREIRGPRDSGE
ncbi:MAG: diacylglycerol/lipid kinase family protein [Ktedonobacterales bacterium]